MDVSLTDSRFLVISTVWCTTERPFLQVYHNSGVFCVPDHGSPPCDLRGAHVLQPPDVLSCLWVSLPEVWQLWDHLVQGNLCAWLLQHSDCQNIWLACHNRLAHYTQFILLHYRFNMYSLLLIWTRAVTNMHVLDIPPAVINLDRGFPYFPSRLLIGPCFSKSVHHGFIFSYIRTVFFHNFPWWFV